MGRRWGCYLQRVKIPWAGACGKEPQRGADVHIEMDFRNGRPVCRSGITCCWPAAACAPLFFSLCETRP